jgi:hypothetical protein
MKPITPGRLHRFTDCIGNEVKADVDDDVVLVDRFDLTACAAKDEGHCAVKLHGFVDHERSS